MESMEWGHTFQYRLQNFWLSTEMYKESKGKCRDLACNLKADKISLVYHMNQTKKRRQEKQNKINRSAIKSRNGLKNPLHVSERWERLW